jgi:N-acetylmuramate 1-kinase
MSERPDQEILQCAQHLLLECGILGKAEAQSLLADNVWQKISSDGSTRRFWRAAMPGKNLCIIGAPSGNSTVELAEARSAWKIGRHLHAKGVAVPEIYAWDRDTGVLLFEDLGDIRLHDIVQEQFPGLHEDEGREYYRIALRQLATMQLQGYDGFEPAWCWDGPRYDVKLMLERESGYFLRAFWQGLLGQQENGEVVEEFRDIAESAAKASTNFFLHRDFQSRNIMVQDGRLRFIDFQAGRLGPLGYDVASLLIDPYVALPLRFQEELVDFYSAILATRRPGSEGDFKSSYKFLTVQRNLQIVGAFAFLSKVRGKTFFTAFIHPALQSLRERLADNSFSEHRRIRALVDRGLAMLQTG